MFVTCVGQTTYVRLDMSSVTSTVLLCQEDGLYASHFLHERPHNYAVSFSHYNQPRLPADFSFVFLQLFYRTKSVNSHDSTKAL